MFSYRPEQNQTERFHSKETGLSVAAKTEEILGLARKPSPIRSEIASTSRFAKLAPQAHTPIRTPSSSA